jgi:PAS domain S-box-containing protein
MAAGPGPSLNQGWSPRIAGWLGLAVLVALVGSLSVSPRPAGTRDLGGVWPAVAEDGAATTIALPGLFANQGLDPDGRYTIRIPVEIPEGESPAFWADSLQHAARVTWDGREIARAGDPDDPNGARSDRPLLVPLPAEPGRHELGLEIRGDFGEGGAIGRLQVGPFDVLRRVHARVEGLWLGMAFGLSLLGFGKLAVGSRRAWQPAHLFFGLFCVGLSVWAFAHADASWDVFADAAGRLRLGRLAQGLLPGLGLAFVGAYLNGDIGRREHVVLGLSAGLGLAGLLVPREALHALETTQDVVTVIAVVAFAVLAGLGWRRGVPGAPLLVLALLPLVWGASHDVLVTQGLLGGGTDMFGALALFVGASSAALNVTAAADAERHRRLVTESVDAMVGVDSTGIVSDANPAAVALLGPSVGHSLLESVRTDDRPVVRAHISRSTVKADRAEFRLEGRDVVVESIATPLDPHTTLLVLRDVTRRRQLDDGLLQAARMETVAVLVGGIAHDFNNMLGTLLAHVGFLQATIPQQDVQGRLDRMESTISRASLLTRRLLAVAGGTSSDLEAVSVAAIARGAAELVEPTLPPGVTLELDLPDDLPPVLGSAADLEHVLVNLLVNARDAVAVAGKLRMVARRYLVGAARGVLLAVEDDGPGVPAHLREQVFAPFFTTKGPNRGTGLGLAVASQILRDHHGRLWYEDRPGGGARFCLALRHADTMDQAPAPLPQGRRVLIVEDEPALLDAYTTALREAGYAVTACVSGMEALRELHRQAPDILVTDVVMPGISGLDVATACRQLYPRVPVLLVSGFIPEGAIPGLQDGSIYRLDKPVRAARLVATVGRLGRRAERANAGDLDITEVSWLFPPLDDLTAAKVGL